MHAWQVRLQMVGTGLRNNMPLKLGAEDWGGGSGGDDGRLDHAPNIVHRYDKSHMQICRPLGNVVLSFHIPDAMCKKTQAMR